ncbi:MAG TPA: glycoside hydrolase family 95 protein, partial [Ohtaekwangia sp.]|nr:glycoside hydrolase family 95 protein [Ohtaekwangia sp.]
MRAQSPLSLWYEEPAREWNEALPVGNGRLGAMVFGGIIEERLQLNEETCWSGEKFDFVNPNARKSLPRIRKLLFEGKYVEAKELAEKSLMGDKRIHSSYQTLGDLRLFFDHDASSVSGYRRELDIENAIAKVSFQTGGVRYHREIFSSAPDNVVAVRMVTSGEGTISFRAELTRPGNKAAFRKDGNNIVMAEHVGDGTGVR